MCFILNSAALITDHFKEIADILSVGDTIFNTMAEPQVRNISSGGPLVQKSRNGSLKAENYVLLFDYF